MPMVNIDIDIDIDRASSAKICHFRLCRQIAQKPCATGLQRAFSDGGLRRRGVSCNVLFRKDKPRISKFYLGGWLREFGAVT